MNENLTLTINVTPGELGALAPFLQELYRARRGPVVLADRPASVGIEDLVKAQAPGAVVPENDGPFGPPPAATAPWKGVADAPAPVAPAPAAPAPVAPAAPAPVAPVAVDLDADGYPWDARIHSSSRAKLVKGGTWKLIRGADDANVEAVRSEYRAAGYGVAPAPAAPAPAAPAPAAPAPAAPAAAAPAPVAPAAPAAAAPAPVAPVAPAAAAPAPAGACTTFPDFVKRVTVAKIPNETLLHALHAEGVEGLALLPANVEKIPAIAARLGI